MGVRSRLLIDQLSFTASTNNLNIPADNVKYLQFGIACLQNGGTAPTLAAIDGVVDEVLANLGGHQICKLRFDDLKAYNMLWLDNTPWFDLGGGDNYIAGNGGVKLPLYVTKRGRSLNTQVTFGTSITNGDATTLSVEYQYLNSTFPHHFAYQYESRAAAVNARWTGLQRVGASLQGILVYDPRADLDDDPQVPNISKLSVVIDDREVYACNFATMKVHHFTHNSTDSTSTWGDKFGDGHYHYIDFSQEPWRADDLEVITSNACGAYTGGGVETCRLIGVYAEP